jgi:hypothetical protein
VTHYQTCRRHPEVGRFILECYGCKRDLFDIQARNAAEAARAKTAREQVARTALATIGTDTTVRILSVTQVGTGLVVATEQPESLAYRFAVDVFRMPTDAETNPELADDYRLEAGTWLLIDQYGDHTRADVHGMVQDALGYLAELGITAEPALVAA